MSIAAYLIHSLLYYWRTNLAVLLGVVVGTEVIGGALIVGDSVRDSLRSMSLQRLGQVDHALTTHRFFREELANDLQQLPEFQSQGRFDAIAPALVMEGSLAHELDADDQTAIAADGNHSQFASVNRANRVNIYGVDERLWSLVEHGTVDKPDEGQVVLSGRVARQLQVQAGDEVTLWIELPATIPRDSLLGDRNEAVREIPLVVQAVLDESAGAGRFDLNPSQQIPLTAFVALDTLQSHLNLAGSLPTRDNPEGAPARVNALFVSATRPDDQSGATAEESADRLTALVSQKLALEDLGLRIQPNSQHGYLSLESDRMILEDALAQAGERAAKKTGLSETEPSKVLVYLANEIVNEKDPDKYSMYSVIAGMEAPAEAVFGPTAAPFGPFEFVGAPPDSPITDARIASGGPGEIVLNEWLAQDLGVQPGDFVVVKYHVVGSHGELPEESRRFQVRGVVKLEGTPADDRGLTPTVPGITTARTFADWDQPFPMKLSPATAGEDGHYVTQRDEDYWEKYRATPKAFVTLSAAQHLWRSRYGEMTSLRIAKQPDQSLEQSAQRFRQALLDSLDAEQLGLTFEPVKYQGLQAASGTTDFSGLFIGFSFFLILSAAILIGLLFRLGVERRGGQIGLLSAVGFSHRQVRRLYLIEGLVVVGLGGLLGTAAAVGYAWLMIYGLKTWWIGAIGTTFLFISVKPGTLTVGFLISATIAGIAIWWALRIVKFLSIRELLAGVTQPVMSVAAERSRGRRAGKLGAACFVLAAALLIGAVTGVVPNSEAFSGFSWQVVAFFIVGIALLAGSLNLLAAWLDSDHSAAVRGGGMSGLGRLGMRNASRHRQRSVLTVGLIASATFVIMAVAAGQRTPTQEQPVRHSGNGGFLLVAESSLPILYDLNTASGRDQLDFWVEENSPEAALVQQMHVMPFRVKPGEDASCLNLYRTRLPTVLGVPQVMIERGGFKFVGADVSNPWTLLNQEMEHDPDDKVPVYPVLGDMNTLQYSLHKGIGDEIAVPDEGRPDYKLRIVGMFDGSVFQGVLLMSEENFQRLHPEQVGYRYFLIGDHRYRNPGSSNGQLSKEDAQELSRLLESGLVTYGFDAEPVTRRLENFLAVQNTYLSTFQALGGFGLLLGTFGLATVMLRNVLERRSEIALLRAVGFRDYNLGLLILWENAFLLIWGLLAGTTSALLAMAPHLMSIGADVPWRSGGLILSGVFLVGMLAALLAVREAARTPLLTTLRAE